MKAKIALYRHFDTNGRLLYVGISISAPIRTSQHSRKAPWFEQVARIELEWFSSRSEAEAAEWSAIKAERPLHNQTHNRSTPAPAEPIVVMDAGFNVLPMPAYAPRNRRGLAAIRRANIASRA